MPFYEDALTAAEQLRDAERRTEYTPTPWQIGGNNRYSTSIWAGDRFIAATDGMTAPVPESHAEANANARRIAHCVNNFEALIYRLEQTNATLCAVDSKFWQRYIDANAAVLAIAKEAPNYKADRVRLEALLDARKAKSGDTEGAGGVLFAAVSPPNEPGAEPREQYYTITAD